ncbi:hypothetical protein FSP39_002207 [Pinctada imbricata]|uniref:SAM domain-containing protein n=1 Tax=Pinctada imbricata TaxID=66713 RepID=A0AA88Y9L7_PINIB|nr:hypothetical protein FSP39_002207 [Pinctada imbricata]
MDSEESKADDTELAPESNIDNEQLGNQDADMMDIEEFEHGLGDMASEKLLEVKEMNAQQSRHLTSENLAEDCNVLDTPSLTTDVASSCIDPQVSDLCTNAEAPDYVTSEALISQSSAESQSPLTGQTHEVLPHKEGQEKLTECDQELTSQASPVCQLKSQDTGSLPPGLSSNLTDPSAVENAMNPTSKNQDLLSKTVLDSPVSLDPKAECTDSGSILYQSENGDLSLPVVSSAEVMKTSVVEQTESSHSVYSASKNMDSQILVDSTLTGKESSLSAESTPSGNDVNVSHPSDHGGTLNELSLSVDAKAVNTDCASLTDPSKMASTHRRLKNSIINSTLNNDSALSCVSNMDISLPEDSKESSADPSKSAEFTSSELSCPVDSIEQSDKSTFPMDSKEQREGPSLLLDPTEQRRNSTLPVESIEHSDNVTLPSPIDSTEQNAKLTSHIESAEPSADATSPIELREQSDTPMELREQSDTPVKLREQIDTPVKLREQSEDSSMNDKESLSERALPGDFTETNMNLIPPLDFKETSGSPSMSVESAGSRADNCSPMELGIGSLLPEEPLPQFQRDSSNDSNGKTVGDTAKVNIQETAQEVKESVQTDNEEAEFTWETYLEQTGSVAAPPQAFKHVELSLESGFIKGMKLEVPNKCTEDTYWVASVVMTCGQLLRLRFDGYEDDKSADFWCDLMTSEIHPIGWCAQNNQVLQPPEEIKDKFDDWREFLVRSLTGARTAPSYLLDKTTGITPVDQLKPGMCLEIQHPISPVEVWFVTIIENVGGRLYLRFEGVESGGHDFWLFYLNHRLHPLGWAKTQGFTYRPPKELFLGEENLKLEETVQTILQDDEQSTFCHAIFRDQEEIPSHTFQVGQKLEALSPIHRFQVCPATVTEVLDDNYFVVEIDNMSNSSSDFLIRFSCHAKSKVIFPCLWCHNNGVKITSPKGWQKSEFSWSEYLKYCNATAAPQSCFPTLEAISEFQKGMKLEAVNPENPNQICAATVVKAVEPLLWIHLDNSMKLTGSHIEHCESHNLFPVGWCESNEYQLRPPRILPSSSKKVAVVEPETRNWSNEAFTQMKLGQETGDWCPKIYYNHRCFSGPSLSKGRIAALPKFVGPGPMVLVMKEVVSNLINVAYKSCQVLRDLQLEGKPNPNMLQQTIKAKYKGKSYRAIVELCKETSQLQKFCRYICSKLECCPNLISTTNYHDSCPENCGLQTKTQFQTFFAKAKVKKPVGRPPNNPPNGENMPKKRGRKKKYQIMSPNVKGEENGSDGESPGSDGLDENDLDRGASSKYKRKYTHHIPPPTEIKTRGAKLPKYSYDRKTHKKILLAHRSHDDGSHKVKVHRADGTKKHHNTSVVKPELILNSNPLYWSVNDVVSYIKSTECAQLARLLKEQDIDGQALLLLSLPVLQEYLDLKLGPAIKLCHHIEKIKLAFYRQYANLS